MGLISNRVDKSEIKAGDHIYTYRAVFAYSHHGIYVGGNKVVHFTHFAPDRETSSSTGTTLGSNDEMSKMPSPCSTYPDCGFRQPKSGVVLSCLDCFLKNGALYSFEYGVTPTVFLAKVRGGTCTTAMSDGPETVIHRAMYLLQNGFGNYDVFQRNCEDFALYCKTGLAVHNDQELPSGNSSKVNGWLVLPFSVIVSMTLVRFVGTPVVASVALMSHLLNRYASDIGVRDDALPVKFRRLPLHFLDVENIRTRTESMMAVLNNPELKRIEDAINAGN